MDERCFEKDGSPCPKQPVCVGKKFGHEKCIGTTTPRTEGPGSVTGYIARLEYWKKRCLAAEKYIELSPCDPDIYDDQMRAYREWQEIFESEAI